MLHSLRIENFAIIDQVAIHFEEGMTVLSGETGAGKSIIIDAIGILCGGRGSADFIRQGSDRLLVEGLFYLEPADPLRQLLKDLDLEMLDPEDDLIIQREIQQNGRNIIKINQRLANVSTLKRIGAFLVDIHGQNEHQALLDPASHLDLLDRYAHSSIQSLYQNYQTAYLTYKRLRHDLLHQEINEQEALQRIDFLDFQWQELKRLDLVAGEDQSLLADSKRLQGAQVMGNLIDQINRLMTDHDLSVDNQLDQVYECLQDLQEYDEKYGQIAEQIKSMQIDLKEYARQIAYSFDLPDYDETMIDEIEGRLNILDQAKRKFGRDIDELITYQEDIAQELDQLRNREDYRKQLILKVQASYEDLLQQAQALSQARQMSAQELSQDIHRQLQDLYMPNTRFEVRFAQVVLDTEVSDLLGRDILKLSSKGLDQVEFYAMTNLGEASQPIAKIASGGELSRFMLALKTIFTRNQAVETLIFDEIDTGVSGRVATAIASKMKEISGNKQVLCITHLAQVAAAASSQLIIEKDLVKDRTVTQVRTLNSEERIAVIAAMMSGSPESSSSLKLAEELLSSYTK